MCSGVPPAVHFVVVFCCYADAWDTLSEQQGVPHGCIVFTCLLAYCTATLLALLKAFPSVNPQLLAIIGLK